MRDDEPQVRLDQLLLGELAVALHAVQPLLQLVLGLRAVGLRDLVAADALDLAERGRAGDRGSPRPSRRRTAGASGRSASSSMWRCMAVENSPASIRRARSTSCAALRSGTLPISFRYIRTGSLVGAFSRSTSMRTCVAASVSSPGTSMTSMPSARQVLLHLRQELLDLLGGEVVDGDRFEEVLGGDEPALAPARGDRLLHLVQAHQLTSRFGQRVSSGVPGGRRAGSVRNGTGSTRRLTAGG